MTLDPRDTFGDDRLAHISLKETLEAQDYVHGVPMQAARPTIDMHSQPGGPGLIRQVRYGQRLDVLDPRQDWSLARNVDSGYVGYIRTQGLTMRSAPTHRVAARMTLLFDAPDFKCPNPTPLSCGSELVVRGHEGRFAKLHTGGFVPRSHLFPIATPAPDYVSVAQSLLGTPYLWGGDSAAGIDCSGLVSLALHAAQIKCPGDSDQQQTALGADLPPDTEPQRGDFFFWKGHVALATSATTLIHANAHAMAVAYEPITDAIDRIQFQGDGPVTAHKRLSDGHPGLPPSLG